MEVLNRLVRDESGQDLIEYGLLIGLITAAIVTTLMAIGTKIQAYYSALEVAMKAT